LWRCDDGLFFEVPPLASDALLTTLHSLLENVLQTVCRKFWRIVEQAVLTFQVSFPFSVALPPIENRSSSHYIVSIGLMHELQGFRIQSRNADAPLRKYLVAPPSYNGFF
jgi:hypothetical protein